MRDDKLENQHRKITGYRELNQNEIDLMNEITAIGNNLGELVDQLEAENKKLKEENEKLKKLNEELLGKPIGVTEWEKLETENKNLKQDIIVARACNSALSDRNETLSDNNKFLGEENHELRIANDKLASKFKAANESVLRLVCDNAKLTEENNELRVNPSHQARPSNFVPKEDVDLIVANTTHAFRLTVDSRNNEIEKLKAEIEELKIEIDNSDSHYRILKNKYEQLKAQLQPSEKEISADEMLNHLENRVDLLEKRVDSFSENQAQSETYENVFFVNYIKAQQNAIKLHSHLLRCGADKEIMQGFYAFNNESFGQTK